MEKSHTIILVQRTQAKNSRTFLDYETLSRAVDGICALFERDLKEKYPHQRELTYDVQQLFQWLDHLHDLSALVYDAKLTAYLPFNKAWIKEKMLKQLQRQAGFR
ncbi:g9130 [Coccomyxa elongata]